MVIPRRLGIDRKWAHLHRHRESQLFIIAAQDVSVKLSEKIPQTQLFYEQGRTCFVGENIHRQFLVRAPKRFASLTIFVSQPCRKEDSGALRYEGTFWQLNGGARLAQETYVRSP